MAVLIAKRKDFGDIPDDMPIYIISEVVDHNHNCVCVLRDKVAQDIIRGLLSRIEKLEKIVYDRYGT